MIKKKAAIVCFTPNGRELSEKIQDCLKDQLFEVMWEAETFYRPIPFSVWTKEHFQKLDALLFIGAMGIAVRGIAPCLKDKRTDPAVLVLDEKGTFVISVLSGHLGGANDLAGQLAGMLGATPVITTASDVNGKLAIDVFAKNNSLEISSMKQAKLCAAQIVSGNPVSFSCDGAVYGNIPPELSARPSDAKFHVAVSPYRQKNAGNFLHLIPKAFVVGIGCKRGTGAEQIEERLEEELQKKNIDPRSILATATIDLKKDEEGLSEFFRQKKIPLYFYSAEELLKVEGNFTPSQFVAQVTGVENVCERAAFLTAKEHGMESLERCMVLPKSGKNGVTIAIMRIDWRICFE